MKSFIAAAALVLLLPALALAQKTSFDFDKTADFSKFKTYTLKDGTKVGDPLIDNRIVAAIEAEFAAKGLTRSDAKPDVVAVYHVAFDKTAGHHRLQLGLRWLRRLRLSVWRRLGHDHDRCARQRDPRRDPGHRCRRHRQERSRVARHGRQGSRRASEGRQAGQEHQQRCEEGPQGLSTQEEGVEEIQTCRDDPSVEPQS